MNGSVQKGLGVCGWGKSSVDAGVGSSWSAIVFVCVIVQPSTCLWARFSWVLVWLLRCLHRLDLWGAGAGSVSCGRRESCFPVVLWCLWMCLWDCVSVACVWRLLVVLSCWDVIVVVVGLEVVLLPGVFGSCVGICVGSVLTVVSGIGRWSQWSCIGGKCRGVGP